MAFDVHCLLSETRVDFASSIVAAEMMLQWELLPPCSVRLYNPNGEFVVLSRTFFLFNNRRANEDGLQAINSYRLNRIFPVAEIFSDSSTPSTPPSLSLSSSSFCVPLCVRGLSLSLGAPFRR